MANDKARLRAAMNALADIARAYDGTSPYALQEHAENLTTAVFEQLDEVEVVRLPTALPVARERTEDATTRFTQVSADELSARDFHAAAEEWLRAMEHVRRVVSADLRRMTDQWTHRPRGEPETIYIGEIGQHARTAYGVFSR